MQRRVKFGLFQLFVVLEFEVDSFISPGNLVNNFRSFYESFGFDNYLLKSILITSSKELWL